VSIRKKFNYIKPGREQATTSGGIVIGTAIKDIQRVIVSVVVCAFVSGTKQHRTDVPECQRN